MPWKAGLPKGESLILLPRLASCLEAWRPVGRASAPDTSHTTSGQFQTEAAATGRQQRVPQLLDSRAGAAIGDRAAGTALDLTASYLLSNV